MDGDKLKRFKISWFENGICYTALSLLALLPIVELILRQFNATISGFRAILIHIFLVVGCFTAMLTAKYSEHISITVTQFIKNEKIKKLLVIFCTLTGVFLLSVLAWDCVSFIKFGLIGKKAGFLTDRIFAAAMPLCFFVIAVRFCLKLNGWKQRLSAFGAMLLGFIAALPAIAKIIWGFDAPEPFYTWVNQLYDLAYYIRIPAVVFLVFTALCGMPVFAAIGGIALILLQAGGLEPDAAPIQIYSALTEQDIIAIPLFTLTGFFLSESKAGERLVRVFRAFLGWLPGGMIIAIIIICVFFFFVYRRVRRYHPRAGRNTLYNITRK